MAWTGGRVGEGKETRRQNRGEDEKSEKRRCEDTQGGAKLESLSGVKELAKLLTQPIKSQFFR